MHKSIFFIYTHVYIHRYIYIYTHMCIHRYTYLDEQVERSRLLYWFFSFPGYVLSASWRSDQHRGCLGVWPSLGRFQLLQNGGWLSHLQNGNPCNRYINPYRIWVDVFSLQLTCLPLKMDGWKMNFLSDNFPGWADRFRECVTGDCAGDLFVMVIHDLF